MRRLLRHRPSAGLVVATFALFLGAGGTTIAARSGPEGGKSTVGDDDVGSSEIRDGSVRHRDLGTSSVHGRVIPEDSIGAREVNEKTLRKVPTASGADYAERADVANFAQVADGLRDEIVIPRTLVDLTGFAPTQVAAGGNIRNLASIGRIRVDGLCRITSGNGVGFGRNTPGVTEGGESEAKIIIWTTDGTLSFEGMNGPRINVPGGAPVYTNPETVTDDPQGEGEHQFIGASNDSNDEERFYQSRYPAFHAGGGYAAVDLGDEIALNMYAGVNTLGAIDQCVFGGVVKRTR